MNVNIRPNGCCFQYLLNNYLATLVLPSSSGPPWLHFPVDDASGSEKWKKKRRLVISWSLIIWSNMTIFSCWLFNRYWKQQPVGRMFTFMIWSSMATFCRRWTKRFWIKKTNKSWTYIYLYLTLWVRIAIYCDFVIFHNQDRLVRRPQRVAMLDQMMNINIYMFNFYLFSLFRTAWFIDGKM
jgi:hypothetical protein